MFWCGLFCMSQENLMYLRNIALPQTCPKRTIFCLRKNARVYTNAPARMTSACGTMQAFKKGLAWIGVVRSQCRSELQDRNLYGSDWSHGLRNPTEAWPSHPHRPNHANHPTHPSHHVNFPDHPDHPNNLISTLDHPDVLLNKAHRTHLGGMLAIHYSKGCNWRLNLERKKQIAKLRGSGFSVRRLGD